MANKRTFEVLKILKEKSNRNNKLTIKQIISMFQDENYSKNRNTIKEDINKLIDVGYRIVKTECRHNTSCYYYESDFSIEECRIILDALYSNKFIKDKDKRIIKEKILLNISYKDRLTLRNCIRVESIDTREIDINTNLLILHKAVEEWRIIDFINTTRDIINIKKNIKKKEVKSFIPKEIYYYNDRYYLIGLNVENQVRHYRIDRIVNINIKDFHNNIEKIDLKRYALKNFDMFGVNREERVEFKIKNTLINSVIEKFGDEVDIHKCVDDEEYFILNTVVGVNRGLIRWILKQGSEIQVLYPEILVKLVKDEVEKIIKLYK